MGTLIASQRAYLVSDILSYNWSVSITLYTDEQCIKVHHQRIYMAYKCLDVNFVSHKCRVTLMIDGIDCSINFRLWLYCQFHRIFQQQQKREEKFSGIKIICSGSYHLKGCNIFIIKATTFYEKQLLNLKLLNCL